MVLKNNPIYTHADNYTDSMKTLRIQESLPPRKSLIDAKDKFLRDLQDALQKENTIANHISRVERVPKPATADSSSDIHIRFGLVESFIRRVNDKRIHEKNAEKLQTLIASTRRELAALKAAQTPNVTTQRTLTIHYRNGVIKPTEKVGVLNRYRWEMQSGAQAWTPLGVAGDPDIRPCLTDGEVRLSYRDGRMLSNRIKLTTVIKRQAAAAKRKQHRFRVGEPEFEQRCKGVAGRIERLLKPPRHLGDADFQTRVFQDRVAQLPEHLNLSVVDVIDLCKTGTTADSQYVHMIEFVEPTVFLNPRKLHTELKEIYDGNRIVLRLPTGGVPEEAKIQSDEEDVAQVIAQAKRAGDQEREQRRLRREQLRLNALERERRERREEEDRLRRAAEQAAAAENARREQERIQQEQAAAAENARREQERIQQEQAAAAEKALQEQERIRQEQAAAVEKALQEQAKRLEELRIAETRAAEDAAQLEKEKQLAAQQQSAADALAEAQRLAEEEELNRLNLEKEKKRLEEEEAAAKAAAEAEAARLAKEAADAKAAAEAEAARLAKEAADAKAAEEAETARLAKEAADAKAAAEAEAARLVEEERQAKIAALRNDPEQMAFIKYVFTTYDKNGDQKIDELEMVKAYIGSTHVVAGSGMNVIRENDQDGDGTISLDEFIDWCAVSDVMANEQWKEAAAEFKQNLTRQTTASESKEEFVHEFGNKTIQYAVKNNKVRVGDLFRVKGKTYRKINSKGRYERVTDAPPSGGKNLMLMSAQPPPGELSAMIDNMTDDWVSSDEELNFAEQSENESMDFAASSSLDTDSELEFAQSSERSVQANSSEEESQSKTSSGLEFAESSAADTDSELEFAESSDKTSSGLEFAESSAVESD